MLASVPSASSSFFVRKVDFQVCRKSDEVLCTICGQELTCKCLLNVSPRHDADNDDYNHPHSDDNNDDDDHHHDDTANDRTYIFKSRYHTKV